MPSRQIIQRSWRGGAHRSQSRHNVFFFATSAPMCLDITSLKGAMMELAPMEGVVVVGGWCAAPGSHEKNQKNSLELYVSMCRIRVLQRRVAAARHCGLAFQAAHRNICSRHQDVRLLMKSRLAASRTLLSFIWFGCVMRGKPMDQRKKSDMQKELMSVKLDEKLNENKFRRRRNDKLDERRWIQLNPMQEIRWN